MGETTTRPQHAPPPELAGPRPRPQPPARARRPRKRRRNRPSDDAPPDTVAERHGGVLLHDRDAAPLRDPAFNFNHHRLPSRYSHSLRDSTGGAGVVTYRGDDPDPVSATAHGVGRCGSSYRTEMAALLFALTSLLSRDVKGTSVIIYTDSQSAVRKLCSGAAAAREEHDFAIWTSLRELTVERHCRITIQFVPGHAGLAGNELADSAAKRGLDILVPATRLSLTCAKSLFRRFINKHVRQRPADVYVVKGPPLRPPLSNPRLTHRGEVLAACIRTGQHTLIRTMDFGSGGYVSATCECGAARSLEHMLSQCSRTTEARARYLPHGNWRYAVLFHESKLLDFLVAAGHVPGPLSVYLTPSPPAAAAHATVAVAAAISAVLALA